MSVRVYVTVCMKVERYVCHYVCINVCMVACIYVCLRSIQNLLVFPRMTQSRTAAGGASVSGVRPPSIFARNQHHDHGSIGTAVAGTTVSAVCF